MATCDWTEPMAGMEGTEVTEGEGLEGGMEGGGMEDQDQVGMLVETEQLHLSVSTVYTC